MKVESILDLKGGDVISILPSASLGEASRVLTERGIGALIVMDEQENLRGILSERDIVRTVANKGAIALEMQVSAAMTSDVVTISREESVQGAMTRMTGRRIRHLPVVEGGKLLGMISIGDVVKHRIEEAEAEASTLRAYIAS